MADLQVVENDIQSLIEQIVPAAAAGSAGDRLASGLDSVIMVDLLAAIEERFQISIPPEEIIPENFASMPALTSMVARLAG